MLCCAIKLNLLRLVYERSVGFYEFVFDSLKSRAWFCSVLFFAYKMGNQQGKNVIHRNREDVKKFELHEIKKGNIEKIEVFFVFVVVWACSTHKREKVLSAGQRVYRLFLKGGVSFVVKGERISKGENHNVMFEKEQKESARMCSHFMRAVSAVGALLPCSELERDIIFDCMKPPTTIEVIGRKPEDLRGDFEYFNRVEFFFVKMPFVNVTTLDSIIINVRPNNVKLANAQKFKMRWEANSFACVVQMGMIASVDCFLGNADRFDMKGNDIPMCPSTNPTV